MTHFNRSKQLVMSIFRTNWTQKTLSSEGLWDESEGKSERRRVETLGVASCQGQPNTLTPWQQLGEVGLSVVISLGLSRDFLCLMYFQVPCDFKLYCLLNELSGFLRIVSLSVSSVTTLERGRDIFGKRNTKCIVTQTVNRYNYCFDLISKIVFIYISVHVIF